MNNTDNKITAKTCARHGPSLLAKYLKNGKTSSFPILCNNFGTNIIADKALLIVAAIQPISMVFGQYEIERNG